MLDILIPALYDRWLRTGEVIGPENAVTGGPLKSRSGVVPSVWFIDAQLGSDSNDGRNPKNPVKTLATVFGNGSSSKAKSGDTVLIVGNFTEEVTAYNLLEDITLIGIGNRPRHADKARDYASYSYAGISGCSWRQASSHGATTPLLKLRGQGWHIENILFVPPSDAAALYLERNALSDVSEYDPSHLVVKGCRFAGGQDGVHDVGGSFNVKFEDCKFHDQTSVGIEGINTAVAVPSHWEIVNCRFDNNAEHVKMSLSYGTIRGNVFGRRTGTYGLNIIALSAQGDYNNVFGNTFAGDYDGGYLGGANDNWAGNYSMDVSSAEVGAEGLTTAAPVA